MNKRDFYKSLALLPLAFSLAGPARASDGIQMLPPTGCPASGAFGVIGWVNNGSAPLGCISGLAADNSGNIYVSGQIASAALTATSSVTTPVLLSNSLTLKGASNKLDYISANTLLALEAAPVCGSDQALTKTSTGFSCIDLPTPTTPPPVVSVPPPVVSAPPPPPVPDFHESYTTPWGNVWVLNCAASTGICSVNSGTVPMDANTGTWVTLGQTGTGVVNTFNLNGGADFCGHNYVSGGYYATVNHVLYITTQNGHSVPGTADVTSDQLGLTQAEVMSKAASIGCTIY